MRVKQWAAVSLAIAALTIAPAGAAPIDAKPIGQKWAPTKARHAESLAQKIDGLLRAPLAQSIAGTIMSPSNATRVSIAVANGVKSVTLIDAKTAAVAGQWTLTAASNATDVARVSSAVLEGMGLKPFAQRTAKSIKNKAEGGK